MMMIINKPFIGGGGGGANNSSRNCSSAESTSSIYSKSMVALVVMAATNIIGLTLTQLSIERNASTDHFSQITSIPTYSSNSIKQQQQKRPTLRRRATAADAVSSMKKYAPYTCPELFAMDARDKVIATDSGIVSVQDPNEGILHARRTVNKPNFWISLHQEKFDSTRWPVMELGDYYESKQSQAFVQIFQSQQVQAQQQRQPQQDGDNAQPLHLLDVGGNIGWYSMLSVAAALEVNRSVVVDVFEPNPRNRYRMCESIQMNHWIDNPKVQFNIYPYGVSSASSRDSNDVIKMSISDSGIGRLGRLSTLATENIPVRLVSLDDMTPQLGWEQEEGRGSNKAPISILKVDVEGLEWKVFQGAKGLLQSGRVENIFFEGNIRSKEESADFRSIVGLLVQSGYHAHMRGGWLGPAEPVRTPPIVVAHQSKSESKDIEDSLIANYTAGLIDECFMNRNVNPQQPTPADQCNLWWKKT